MVEQNFLRIPSFYVLTPVINSLTWHRLLNISFISKVHPSDANFILVKVDDANKRYQELINEGIVVRNRTTQLLCENCLRFTVGTKEENEKLVKTLNKLS